MIGSISQNSYLNSYYFLSNQKIAITFAAISYVALKVFKEISKTANLTILKAAPIIAIVLLATAMIINQISMWNKTNQIQIQSAKKVEVENSMDLGYSYWT